MSAESQSHHDSIIYYAGGRVLLPPVGERIGRNLERDSNLGPLSGTLAPLSGNS